MTRLLVLVDNEPGPGLLSAWGLSIYVEHGGLKILFDADTDPAVLRHNMEALGVDPSTLDFAVLSHPHHDHYGGFKYIGERNPRLTVYIPAGSGVAPTLENWGLEVVEVHETIEVAKGVYILGPIAGKYKRYTIPEQALVIEHGGQAIVVVGCSHPGIDVIAERVVNELRLKPKLVIGGFHAPPPEALDRLAEIVEGKICPLHCTGPEAVHYLETRYPHKLLKGRTGYEIKF